ncbi:30S ribosomal protein S4e [Candidatus Micrarchaeota archaeon]|nr:30S ribosomal protein S4e [Candidatus Micrarchaeota archaeon]MBU1165942.1 30S ribosomal protein S4e [Candidatus Micrarchaeota archaeon]MBU1886846.1 30S ribosomal protein S4e [Candidatus Micrarchaeota archaeon]
MAKRGAKKHTKRITTPKAVPIHDKKAFTWILGTSPGPHPVNYSISLGVLLRDVMKIARTAKEVKKILSSRLVTVDGKVRASEKFPIGLMDVVSIPKDDKHYKVSIDGLGRLGLYSVQKSDTLTKLARVIKKHVIRAGKINLTFHDGRNLIADNHVMVGDSVVLSLPDGKMKSHLNRKSGSKCLILHGKHVGSIVELKEIIERKGGKPSEALVTGDSGEFVTVAKYLFVIDDTFGKVNE